VRGAVIGLKGCRYGGAARRGSQAAALGETLSQNWPPRPWSSCSATTRGPCEQRVQAVPSVACGQNRGASQRERAAAMALSWSC
jgi:hypothetical protein